MEIELDVGLGNISIYRIFSVDEKGICLFIFSNVPQSYVGVPKVRLVVSQLVFICTLN